MAIGAAGRRVKETVRRPARTLAGTVPPPFREFFGIFRSALVGTYEDGCIGTAKSAAYSALLSFFPLLATVATILVHARADFISQAIYNFLAEVLPPGTEDLVFDYFTIAGKQPFLLPVTGMLVSIWGASGLIVSLIEGFKTAYRIPTGRPFVRQRIVALLLVFSAAIPVLVASTLLLLGARVEQSAAYWLGLLPQGAEFRGWVPVMGSIARYLIALGAIILGTSILYYFGPNRPQRWSRVWPGAVLATVLWLGATLLFAWYVRNIAHYNVMYGSIATVILLLVWMYVLSLIAFVGCEFNAAYERRISES